MIGAFRPVPTGVACAAVAVLVLGACADDTNTSQVAPGNEIDVTLGLERDQKGLGTAALDANTPGADGYGDFLTLDEIASEFGASSETKKKVEDVLSDHGADVDFDPTGGFATARMTLSAVTDVFGVEFERQTSSDGIEHISASGATVPSDLQGAVKEVVGLNQSLPSTASPSPLATPTPTGGKCGGTDPTTGLRAVQAPVGIDALAAGGFRGQGMHVAIDSIDAIDEVAFELWKDCVGFSLERPNVVRVHPDDRGLEQEIEVDLDVATITAALPELETLDVLVFDQFDWIGSPIAAALDRGSESGDLPDVIVTSVVFCEGDLTDPAVVLAEWVVASSALVGVPVVSSSGDHGSSGCYPPEKTLAVQYPASSAYATGVGGTQGESDPQIWLDASDEFAGGGGPSADVDRPAYQPSDAGFGAASGDAASKRLTPDVAAPAAPDEAPAIPVCDRTSDTCEWKRLGGTSMSAPLVGAALVQIKQKLAAGGKSALGLLNPTIYGVDDSTRAGFVTDIGSGTNDLFDVGCCRAAPGFDMASGWGSIDVARLADHLETTAPPTG